MNEVFGKMGGSSSSSIALAQGLGLTLASFLTAAFIVLSMPASAFAVTDDGQAGELPVFSNIDLQAATSSLFAQADTLSEDGWDITLDGTLVASGGKLGQAVVEIPDTVAGITVRKIGAGFCQACVKVRDVTIPSTVTEIGGGAFQGCGVKTVRVPAGIVRIGDNCDLGDLSASYYAFPNLEYIGNNVFKSGSFSTFYAPKLTHIGDSAFRGNKNLADFQIPDTVDYIGSHAFRDCESYDLKDFPAALNSLSTGMLSNSGVTTLEVPERFESIPGEFCKDCKYLASVKLHQKSVKNGDRGFHGDQHNGAFQGCSSLTDVDLGQQMTDLKQDAFYGCTSLEHINLPDSLESIWEDCFSESGLVDITIPANVTTSIRPDMFVNCKSLQNIFVAKGNKYYADFDGVPYYHYDYGTGKQLVELAIYPAGRTTPLYTVPSEVTTIGAHCFEGCENLRQIVLTDRKSWNGAEHEFYSAFENCPTLAAIKTDATVDFRKTNGELMSQFRNAPTFTIYGDKGTSAEDYANEYGYPFRSSSEFTMLDWPVANDHMEIAVVDKDTAPIEQAHVSLSFENGAVDDGYTNFQGIASFDNAAIQTYDECQITVTCEGYGTRRIVRECDFGMGIVITLSPDTGKPYVISASCAFEEDGQVTTKDVLTDVVNVKQTDGANEPDVLKVEGSFNASGPAYGKDKLKDDTAHFPYELYSGSTLVAWSTNGIFDIDLSDILSPGKQTYIKLFSQDGSASERVQLGISAIPVDFLGKLEGDWKLVLDEDGSFTLPEEFRKDGKHGTLEVLMGGTKVKHSIFEKVPFNLTAKIEGGKVYVAGGFGHEWKDPFLNQPKSYTQFKDAYKEAFECAKNDKSKLHQFLGNVRGSGAKDALESVTARWLFDTSVEIKGLAYGEGFIDPVLSTPNNPVVNVDVGFVVSAEGKASGTRHWIVLHTPVYFTVAGKLGGEVTARACRFTLSQNGIEYQSIGDWTGKLEGSILPGGGIGYYPHISAGVFGGLEVKHNHYYGTGDREWSFQAKFGYDVHIAGFTIDNDFLDGNSQYKLRLWNGKRVDADTTGLSTQAEAQSLAKAALASAEPTEKSSTPVSVQANDDSVVMTGVNSGAKPKRISCAGSSYLFWLEDDDSRASFDRTRLVYARIQDDGTIGETQAVDDDGTADFDYSLATDGSRIFVAWENAKSAFGDEDVTLEQQFNDLGISLACIDCSDGEITHVRASEGESEIGNVSPQLSARSGKLTLSYNEMTATQIFDEQPSGTTQVVVYDADLNELHRTGVEVSGSIVSTTAGSFGGTPSYAYLVDEDGDFDTEDDRVIAVVDATQQDQVKRVNYPATSIRLACIGGVDRLLIGAGTQLAMTSDLETFQEIDAFSLENGTFEYATAANGMPFLYFSRTEAVDGEATRTLVYRSCFEDGAWTSATAVFSIDDVVRDFSLSQAVDKSVAASYLVGNGSETQMVISQMPDACFFSVEGVDVDETAAPLGQPVPFAVSVVNAGEHDIEALHVTVSLGDNVLYDKEIECAIAANSVGDVALDGFALPTDLAAPGTLEVQVTAGDAQDSATAVVGAPKIDLKTKQYLDNGTTMVSAMVANASALPVNAQLSVARVEDEDNPIEVRSIGSLGAGEKRNVVFTLAELSNRYDLSALEITCMPENAADLEQDDPANFNEVSFVQINVLPQESQEPRMLSLDRMRIEMPVGQSTRLTPELSPVGVDNARFTWSSANDSIASVTSGGLVTAKRAGTVTLTCKYNDTLQAYCTVVVTDADEGEQVVTKIDDPKVFVGNAFGYGYDMDALWVYENPGKKSIDLAFDYVNGASKFGITVYGSEDVVEILDGSDNVVKRYTNAGGSRYYGEKVTVPGGVAKIHVVSRYGESGFTLSSIDGAGAGGSSGSDDRQLPISGESGDVSWTLTADGVLSVSGTGELAADDIDMGVSYEDYVTEIRVGEGITEIGEGCFSRFESTVKVQLPNTLQRIDDYAFYCLEDLSQVNLPEGLQAIGDFAFESAALSTLSIPSSCVSIGECAFAGCASLERVTLAGNAIELGANAFRVSWEYVDELLPTLVFDVPEGSAMAQLLDANPVYVSHTSYAVAHALDNPCVVEVYSSSPREVSLYWDPVVGVSGYEIERSTRIDSGFEVIGKQDGAADSYWDDEDVVPGVTYYYRVRSYVDNASGEGDEVRSWSPYSVALPATPPLYTPAMRSASAQGSSIRVNWYGLWDVDGYEVWRSVNGGAWTKMATLFDEDTTSWLDGAVPAGAECSYRIRAFVESGAQLSYSSYSSSEEACIMGTPKAAAKNKKGRKLKITWSKQAGATDYEVAYAMNKGFTKKAKKKSLAASKSTLTVKKLKKKKTYYVRVRAVKRTANGTYYGAWSPVKKVKIKK